jgi:hypothetical protein
MRGYDRKPACDEDWSISEMGRRQQEHQQTKRGATGKKTQKDPFEPGELQRDPIGNRRAGRYGGPSRECGADSGQDGGIQTKSSCLKRKCVLKNLTTMPKS